MYHVLYTGIIVIVGIAKIGSGLTALEEFRSATDEAEAVAAFCSEHSPALNVADYLGVNADGVNLTKSWGWDFSEGAPELREIEYIMGSPVLVGLDTHKTGLITLLMEKRDKRFNENYVLAEYPAASGNLFSCATESQNKWNKLATLYSLGTITSPFTVYTYNNRGSYSLADLDDLKGLILTITTAVLQENTLAGSYIAAVLSAVDESAATQAAQPYLDA